MERKDDDEKTTESDTKENVRDPLDLSKWIKELTPGINVDVYDTKIGRWKIATITENIQHTNSITFAYHANLNKNNQIKSEEFSQRIRPLHTYTAIHKYLSINNTNQQIPVCQKCEWTFQCDLCKKYFHGVCTKMAVNSHITIGKELCFTQYKRSEFVYKCYSCFPKIDIHKSCAHCHKKLHFETEFDYKNGIDSNGIWTYQYNTIYNRRAQILLCDHCENDKYNLPKCKHGYDTINYLCSPHPKCGSCDMQISNHYPRKCAICRGFTHCKCGVTEFDQYEFACNKCILSIDVNQIFDTLVKVRDKYEDSDNNGLFGLSDDVLMIITQYSVKGQIINCSVSNCNNEIYFNDVAEIRERKDYDGNRIYYYRIFRGGTYCNAVKLKSLYGKYRIFCKECRHNIKPCQFWDLNDDVERQYDGERYTCLDHAICVYCHRINQKRGNGLCDYCHGVLIHRSPLIYFPPNGRIYNYY